MGFPFYDDDRCEYDAQVQFRAENQNTTQQKPPNYAGIARVPWQITPDGTEDQRPHSRFRDTVNPLSAQRNISQLQRICKPDDQRPGPTASGFARMIFEDLFFIGLKSSTRDATCDPSAHKPFSAGIFRRTVQQNRCGMSADGLCG
jgi:hypothetical protein